MATRISDGTSGDIQAKLDASTHGDIVMVPEGTHNWADPINHTKGVHLQGAGSGRVVGQSASPVAFGTGAKVFVIESSKAREWRDSTVPDIANGTTLRIWWLAHNKDTEYMLGTLTSLVTTEDFATAANTNAWSSDFKYGAGTPYVTGGTPGFLRNDTSGFVGFKFTVGGSPITVSHLARRFATGNTQTHEVKIVRVSDLVEVATVDIDMVGGTNGQFKYQALGASVELAASTAYYLLSREYSGGDQYYEYSTSVTTEAVATLNGYAYTSFSHTATVNVTTSTGSGTPTLWLLATEPLTTVLIDNVSALDTSARPGAINITDHALGSPEVSGIQFNQGAGNLRMLYIEYSPSGGEPALIHDCWFNQGIQNVDIIKLHELRGIIWNCSVTATFLAQSNSQFLHYAAYSRGTSWATPSTFGTNDLTGRSNFYIEDCDIHGFIHATVDVDANSRLVLRYNMLDHCGLGSHGYDTGPFGARHWEYYGNAFVWKNVNGYDSNFDGVGESPLPPSQLIHMRGGTGVITDNYFDEVSGLGWGDKREIGFGVWGLKLWITGPIFAYSGNDGQVPEYPMPRQVGFGIVTGTGVDGQGNTHNEPEGYNPILVGESEPVYVWANMCSGTISITHTEGQDWGGPVADSVNDYLQAGRDYFNNGTPKPGYTKFPHPHPLRTDLAEPPSPGPGTLTAPAFTSASTLSGTAQVGATKTLTIGDFTGNLTPTILDIKVFSCPT